MFDVLHQIIDKVHGWRSEEDRVNAHTAVDEYRDAQEGTDALVPPADGSPDSSEPASTRADTVGEPSQGRKPVTSADLFTPSRDTSAE